MKKAAGFTPTVPGHAACIRWEWPRRATSQAAAERFYFVVKEELCHGHGKGGECAVREFIDGQGVEPYDVMQSPFRRLLAVAAEQKEALTTEQCAMYYMALYDLDRFRRFVFETRFLRFV